MTSSVTVRDHVVRALEADLVGPYTPPADDGGNAIEVLPLAPSRWYLTGFLAPQEGRQDDADPTDDEQLPAGSDEGTEEAGTEEPEPKQRHRLPASIGLSLLIPAPMPGEAVRVTATWADYVAADSAPPGAAAKGRRARLQWRRAPRAPLTLDIALVADIRVPIANTGGVSIVGYLKPAEAPGLASGTHALALFLVNGRTPRDRPRQDEAFMFQVSLDVQHPRHFEPRPTRQGERSREWEERVVDLQLRNAVEYAVGHGASVEIVVEPGSPVRSVRTTWLPMADVRRVVTHEVPGFVPDMEALSQLPDGAAARAALDPLLTAYGEWISTQSRVAVDGDGRRAETRDELVRRAGVALSRIRSGLDVLARDADAWVAFRLANRAMAMAARARSPEQYDAVRRPTWRLFQLAFVLLNLRGLVDGDGENADREARLDRETVELIFFPTGGGKTEAYLGVIAFVLVLRRLRGRTAPDRGLGVAVLLRYTLRLLTLDQLGRAATLVCALELLRRENVDQLGEERFAVGLWVGRTATANTIKAVARQITEYKSNPSPNAPSPFPLTNCPWCRAPLTRDSLTLTPHRDKATGVRVACVRCEFSAARNAGGLPVVFVDEQVYRELPPFLIATVDKFAMLPWRGETGMLFGRVTARRGAQFFGPLDGTVSGAEPLVHGLRPPELIVQDELHLISGPLGTLVGLYETAIGALCERRMGGIPTAPPKIIAATATVRRAQAQIAALFGRADVAVFPPAGADDSSTFFAHLDTVAPGRRYIGVAASGRSMKAILLRTYVALLAAAQHQHDGAENAPPADPYLTLVGYFNSLRELGGMRRLVEDEVRARVHRAEERRPLSAQPPHRWSRNRKIADEPVELTSREPTNRVAQARMRLGRVFGEADTVDVLLASNMISVGIDIERLGLMVVAGQPKTTSEYIQATSRVGRAADKPGLVVTCFNLMKPRDRSHYERFAAYHGSFYRSVEATSVTPFSGPALDRGLAGTLVAITRLLEPTLTAPGAAMEIEALRELAEYAVSAIANRAGQLASLDGPAKEALAESLRRRSRSLVDAWVNLARAARAGASRRCYSPYDLAREGKPMLFTSTDEDPPPPDTDDARFAAPTSMRDVERAVHIWVQPRALGGPRG